MRFSELFIITAQLENFPRFHLNIVSLCTADMSSSRASTLLQHICSEACTKIQLCAALQHSSSLAYLEYCEIPSCASADAVLQGVIEKLGGISRKSALKQWFLLRKTAIFEVEVSFVGIPLPPVSFSVS
jgi:hypothetical protein